MRLANLTYGKMMKNSLWLTIIILIGVLIYSATLQQMVTIMHLIGINLLFF